ncbi:unnamed protein product [Hyaloperonospora brassicae]|uniref:RxLR effector candidate protein n=1 Tax=Hyaloperonospora brassicae TaxID=162125 RepID=A0AAV0UWE3_HYABA|nr:unnamed protein product [Hyaloperonospora brassicae]
MWFSALRQKLQLLVIVFFIFVAFAASEAAWMLWATLVIFLLLLLLIDLLFLNEGDFKYDPDYKVRQRTKKRFFCVLKKEGADKLSVMCDMTELGAFRRPKILKETDSALTGTSTVGKIEKESRYLYPTKSQKPTCVDV